MVTRRELIERVYERLLREGDRRAGAAAAEWGDWLFGDQRGHAEEPNTPEENAAYLSLQRYVTNNVVMPTDVRDRLAGALRRGDYPEILHEPRDEYLFRGMQMDRDQFTRITGLSTARGAPKSAPVSVVLRPRSGGSVTSWTSKWYRAGEFGERQSRGQTHHVGVIWIARPSDNPGVFLSGPDGFYSLPGEFKRFTFEAESIALGPVTTCGVVWEEYDVPEGFPTSFDPSLLSR